MHQGGFRARGICSQEQFWFCPQHGLGATPVSAKSLLHCHCPQKERDGERLREKGMETAEHKERKEQM